MIEKEEVLKLYQPKETKPQKKVAIVGFAPSWVEAPFDNPEFEIWGENTLYRRIPRFTRWFDIHPLETFTKEKKQTDNYLAELDALNVPVYLQKAHPMVKKSIAYPIEAIKKKLETDYFTNSISYMIALAIYERFEEIHVYGVDMAQDSEYSDQRPSCEFFLGIAKGMGIKVHVPVGANLLKTMFQYGYDDLKQDAFTEKEKQRITMMRKKRAEVEAQIKALNTAKAQYDGAIESSIHVVKQWGKVNYRDKYKLNLK